MNMKDEKLREILEIYADPTVMISLQREKVKIKGLEEIYLKTRFRPVKRYGEDINVVLIGYFDFRPYGFEERRNYSEDVENLIRNIENRESLEKDAVLIGSEGVEGVYLGTEGGFLLTDKGRFRINTPLLYRLTGRPPVTPLYFNDDPKCFSGINGMLEKYFYLRAVFFDAVFRECDEDVEKAKTDLIPVVEEMLELRKRRAEKIAAGLSEIEARRKYQVLDIFDVYLVEKWLEDSRTGFATVMPVSWPSGYSRY